MTPAPLARTLACAALLALGACAGARMAAAPPAGSPAQEITALLQTSTEEWNRGNLEGFLVPYSDAPGTTFVGSSGLVRGKDAIREKYRSSYFRPNAPLPGTLSFRDIEVRSLGPRNALAVGRWIVTDRGTGAQSGTGLFSLTLELTPAGWRIIHDHSS
jgi:uncharacterized protein (TIGR02246 family)